jgi:hypothetical protein
MAGKRIIYYVYIQSGSGPLHLYDGRSEDQAEYYTKVARHIMTVVKGTGDVVYCNADAKGVYYFKNGEEINS